MIKHAHTLGQIEMLRTLGFHKQANDMVAELAAREAAEAAAKSAPAAAGAGGLMSRLKGSVPLKAGLGIGGLVAAGMVGHQMGQTPQMEVTPSAPISPMFP